MIIETAETPNLIFIWIGDRLPVWFCKTMMIAKKYSKANIILLCSKLASDHKLLEGPISVYELENFYQRDSRLVNLQYFGALSFRDEFWLKTVERYLVLLAFMKHHQIASCFQAELDNAIFDISTLGKVLDGVGSGIFAPRDFLDRAVPSLVYINSVLALELLCESIFTGYGKKNDMHLLGEFLRDSTLGFSLPTESAFSPKCPWRIIGPSITGGIFDANAIGQYLLGIDPRNHPIKIIARNGFINKNMQADLSSCNFIFDKAEGLYIEMHGTQYRLFNLHIHSKRMQYILDERKLTPILNSISRKKRTYFLGGILAKLNNFN